MWISPRRHVTPREYNRRDRVAYRPHDPSRSMRTSMSRHILSSRRLSLELATFSAEDVSNHRPAPRKPHQDHQQQREEALLHPIHQPSTRTPRPPRSGGLYGSSLARSLQMSLAWGYCSKMDSWPRVFECGLRRSTTWIDRLMVSRLTHRTVPQPVIRVLPG
jgi:hypothetical protein